MSAICPFVLQWRSGEGEGEKEEEEGREIDIPNKHRLLREHRNLVDMVHGLRRLARKHGDLFDFGLLTDGLRRWSEGLGGCGVDCLEDGLAWGDNGRCLRDGIGRLNDRLGDGGNGSALDVERFCGLGQCC